MIRLLEWMNVSGESDWMYGVMASYINPFVLWIMDGWILWCGMVDITALKKLTVNRDKTAHMAGTLFNTLNLHSFQQHGIVIVVCSRYKIHCSYCPFAPPKLGKSSRYWEHNHL